MPVIPKEDNKYLIANDQLFFLNPDYNQQEYLGRILDVDLESDGIYIWISNNVMQKRYIAAEYKNVFIAGKTEASRYL